MSSAIQLSSRVTHHIEGCASCQRDCRNLDNRAKLLVNYTADYFHQQNVYHDTHIRVARARLWVDKKGKEGLDSISFLAQQEMDNAEQKKDELIARCKDIVDVHLCTKIARHAVPDDEAPDCCVIV